MFISKVIYDTLFSKRFVLLLLFSVILTFINLYLLFHSYKVISAIRVSAIQFQIVIQIFVAYILISERILYFIRLGFDKILITSKKGIKFVVFTELSTSIIVNIIIWIGSFIIGLLFLYSIYGIGVLEVVMSVFSGFELSFILLMMSAIVLIQLVLTIFSIIFRDTWGILFAIFLLFVFLMIDYRINFYYIKYFQIDVPNLSAVVLSRLLCFLCLLSILLLCLKLYNQISLDKLNLRLSSSVIIMRFRYNFINIILYQTKYVFFRLSYLLISLLFIVICILEFRKPVDIFGNPFVLSPMTIYNHIADLEILPIVYTLLVIFVIGQLFNCFQSNGLRSLMLIKPISNIRIVQFIAVNFTLFWFNSIVIISITDFIVMSCLYHFDIKYLFIIQWILFSHFFRFVFIGYGIIFIYSVLNNRILSPIVSILVVYLFSIFEFYTAGSDNYYLLFLNFGYIPYSTFSDMNSSIEFIYIWRSFLFVIYWMFICYCLLLLASIVFRRTIDGRLFETIRNANFEVKVSLNKMIAPIVLAVASIWLIIYNVSLNDREIVDNSYDELYRSFLYYANPEVVSVDVELDVDAHNRMATVDASFVLKNISKHKVDTLFLSFPINALFDFKSIEFGVNKDYKTIVNDDVNNVKILALNESLVSGDSLLFNCKYKLASYGFGVSSRDINFVSNGSFFESKDIMVCVGYDLMKGDKSMRVPIPRSEAEERSLLSKYFGGNCKTMKCINLKINCPNNKIAVATGNMKSAIDDGKNHCYQFNINDGFMYFGVFISNYNVVSTKIGDLVINVFFDNKHKDGAINLLKAAEQMMSYCVENFGQLSYDTINIVEATTYRSGGTCFQNMIVLQEDYFTSDFSYNENLKFSYVMLAHEIAHLWWGNELTPANIHGVRVITEGLSEYTAINLISILQSDSLQKVYIQRIINQYKSGWNSDKKRNSLVESTSEEYLIYKKAGLAFYYISKLIGQHKFNEILLEFIDKSKLPYGVEYVSIKDLVCYIISRVSEEEGNIIFELFYGYNMVRFDKLL